MDRPTISPDFTVEDIRKLRDWNYERTRDMTPEERLEDIKRRGLAGRTKLEQARLEYLMELGRPNLASGTTAIRAGGTLSEENLE